MAKKESAEEKLERLAKLNRARVKRYRDTHVCDHKRVNVDLKIDRYNAFMQKLKEKNMTQKQFLEEAIDRFLANQDYEDIQYF